MYRKSIDYATKSYSPDKSGFWEGCRDKKDIFLKLYIEKKFGKDLHYLPFVQLAIINNDSALSHGGNVFILVDRSYKPKIGEMNSWVFNIKEYDPIPDRYYNLYKNTKKRFTYYSFYHLDNEGGHELLFLYDKKTNQVELFDTNTIYKEILKSNRKNLVNFFKKIYNKNVTFAFNLNLDEKIGIIYHNRCDEEDYVYNVTGFCVIYVLWYLELRLANKNIDRSDLIKNMHNFVKNGRRYTEICRLLRGYAAFVDDTVKDYKVLEKSDIALRITKKSEMKTIKKSISENKNIKHKNIMYRILEYINFITFVNSVLKFFKKIEK